MNIDKARKYFSCSDRERAVFEAGIKLGSIYHQFVGTPLSKENVGSVERAIEESAKVQPFVSDVKVKIARKGLDYKKGLYKYITLAGNMLQVRLKIRYRNVEAVCEMRTIKELRYPLMFVKKIKDIKI